MRTTHLAPPYGVYYVVFLSEYADALGRAGQSCEGLAAIGEAIDRSHRNSENWYLAELRRAKGELIVLAGGHDAVVEAERSFASRSIWRGAKKRFHGNCER